MHTVQVQILVHIPVLPQAVRGARKALPQFYLCSQAQDALQSGLSILHNNLLLQHTACLATSVLQIGPSSPDVSHEACHFSLSTECSHQDREGASWALQYLVDEAHMTPFVDYTSVPPKAQREPCIPRTLLRTLFCVTALPIRPPDNDIGFKRNSTDGCIGRGYPRAGYRQVGSHAWPSPSFNPLMTFQCIFSAVKATFLSMI